MELNPSLYFNLMANLISVRFVFFLAELETSFDGKLLFSKISASKLRILQIFRKFLKIP